MELRRAPNAKSCNTRLPATVKVKSRLSGTWKHTFHHKKRMLCRKRHFGSIALGYSYLRRNVVPGPLCSALPEPEHGGLILMYVINS